MNNIYLFKMSNVFGENIEFIVSSRSVKSATVYIKKELKKELIPLKVQARESLRKEIKKILEMGINFRKQSKQEKNESILEHLEKDKLFGIGNKLKVTYNYYMNNKKQFRIDYLREYMEFYYRKDYSFEYNLKNDDFEILNLIKITRSTKKNQIFSELINLKKENLD